MTVDLRVGRGERWPAFIQYHDPVAFFDFGAQVLEAVGAVVPVIAARIGFLDASLPGVVKSAYSAIAVSCLLKPVDGVPGGRRLGGVQCGAGLRGVLVPGTCAGRSLGWGDTGIVKQGWVRRQALGKTRVKGDAIQWRYPLKKARIPQAPLPYTVRLGACRNRFVLCGQPGTLPVPGC